VQDLVYGKPHPLKGDRLGQFAVSLEGAERLVFEPSNIPIPHKEDGSIDWAKVTAITGSKPISHSLGEDLRHGCRD